MTLADLYTQLAPFFSETTRKDLKTAVRVLALALNCPDPEHCSLDQYNRPLPALYRLVEDYLINKVKRPIKPHTVRNTKNLLSRLFRYAEAQHLFSLVPAQLLPHYDVRNRPHRPGASVSRRNGTHLPYAQWPTPLQDAFTVFATWATAPLVPGRDASLKKRPKTVEDYRTHFEGYFGFLAHVEHLPGLTFEQLFDITLVTKFVHWHVNDLHKKPTIRIKAFLTRLLSLTRQYRPLPELHAQFLILDKTIPTPAPVYNKEDAWVSLATLNEIGRSLWPRKQPKDILAKNCNYPGLKHAMRAGLSLMLRLWTYIPYRQRNMREMQLGNNLHKDTHGHWRITFHGEQLKIATKRGRSNIFDLPFPDTLVPVLEDYLITWRPILLTKTSFRPSEVFLNENGTPYVQRHLAQVTKYTVYRYTGKHWHPHIIRTVWATEWIRHGGDFHTAAIMLNDRLETVIAKYNHLLEEDVAEKAYQHIDERNG